eukprot:m.56075 g.56075  ORF g.56075 m.56075 type:complete len:53 (-) comp18705_c1_seq2:250-408(-)
MFHNEDKESFRHRQPYQDAYASHTGQANKLFALKLHLENLSQILSMQLIVQV